MKGREEIYLPTSVKRDELNAQAQAPTLPTALCVSLISLPLEREHSAVRTRTQSYISTFFSPPFNKSRTRHSNQVNPKAGWPATAQRWTMRTSRFLKGLQMMMGNSLK